LDVNNVKSGRYCVYNKTRDSFLALNIARADTHLKRLKGLLGTLRLNSDEGIWVTPSQGVHTIGLRFAIDLVYLNSNHSVIELVESIGTFRIGPLRMNCDSVLELPARAIYHSHTQIHDDLLICSPEELELYFRDNTVEDRYPVTPIRTAGTSMLQQDTHPVFKARRRKLKICPRQPGRTPC